MGVADTGIWWAYAHMVVAALFSLCLLGWDLALTSNNSVAGECLAKRLGRTGKDRERHQ